MIIKNSIKDKAIYFQIAIGLFANLLFLYSIYQIKSVEYSYQNSGIIHCFYSIPYEYWWLVDISWILAMINAIFLSFGVWWQTKIDIKKSVLLLVFAEIFLLNRALYMF